MKKIKFLGLLLMALFVGVQGMNAQNDFGKNPHKGKRMSIEQITEMQANRMVHELGLDDATAAKFIEVYKKYMQELGAVRMEFFKNFKRSDKKQGEDKAKEFKMPIPTDEEVDKMMQARFVQSRKTLDIREKYYKEFRKFLSAKQVQKVYDQWEMNPDKFRNEMNRRQGMKHPGRKRPSSYAWAEIRIVSKR